MNKNHIITVVAIVIVVAGASFYGGIQYANSKTVSQQIGQRANFGGGANGGRGQGQAGGPGGMRSGGTNGGAGDFAGGQIVSKDETSVTIKTRNGSSQIVFFSPTTSVDKSVTGATSDLNVGQQITANGKANPDGSITAQNIQIRPAMANQQGQ